MPPYLAHNPYTCLESLWGLEKNNIHSKSLIHKSSMFWNLNDLLLDELKEGNHEQHSP